MHITAASWYRVSRLLDQALDIEPASRGQWLESLAAEHADLRDILGELLSAPQGTETADFLKRLPEFSPLPAAAGVAAGDLVAPYRLIRELGTGGMATVWLAERADGSFQRQVALKLPHIAWMHQGLAGRMIRERDILATLEHPNIARLYDAGVDAAGRPFLALEYVDGVALDVYIRERALTLRQRLDLFLQIARAVAFAHARLIVHRDLKPSNVLVKSTGDVRLLDFGIARLLQRELELEHITHHTQFGGRALTPKYAAPEQFTGQPITVATDVYSLGVLLYELLTGASPYAPKRDSAGALEDAVLQDEPVAPSRATELVAGRALRGDLDAILGKALKKSPPDRYASVEAFAADIERHLAGQPIAARPASRWYVAQKFIRRNALPLGAATAVVIALGIGLGIAGWQWREATGQRAAAVDMLANSEATLDFTRAVLMEGVRNDETITMDELRSRSEAIAQQLGKNDARTRAVAANFVADWYISMNQFDKAEKLLTRTIDSLPADRHFLSTSSLTCARASAWAQLGRNDEAIAVLTREIERNRNDAARITFCLQVRAEIARASGDTKGALAYNLQALRRFDEAGLRSLRDKAVLLAQIGAAYSLNNTPDQAHAYFGQSFRLFEQTGRADSLDAGAVLNNWGTVVFDAGDPLRARALFERAIAVKQRRSPTDEPPEYATANIAYVLRTLARYPEATAAYDTLQRLGERSGNVSSEAYALVGKARIATLLRHFDQAQDFLNVAAAKILEGRMPAGDPAVRGLKVAQGQVWAAQGRLTDAAAILTEALDSYAKLGCCSGTRSQALIARAGVATANHQLGAALDDAQQALELAQKAQGRMPFSFHTGNAWLMLGRLHQAQGRGEEARQAYALAAQHLANTLGGQHPDTLQASRGMATVH